MNDLLTDVRYAVRTLRRSASVSIAAVALLAVAIGMTATVYSVVHAVLLRPLPYRDPDRLALAWHRVPGMGERVPIAAPDVAFYAANVRAFDGVAFSDRIADRAMARAGSPAVHVRVAGVTANFFEVLGVGAAIGRTFAPGEGLLPSGADPDSTLAGVLVLSAGYWRAQFGGDPGVIGRTVRIDGAPATIIGVLLEQFEFPLPTVAGTAGEADAWTPLPVPLDALRRASGLRDQDSDNTGVAVVRLRAGVALPEAELAVNAAARLVQRADPIDHAAAARVELRALHEDAVARARPMLTVLTIGAFLMLAAACVNLAGLLAARGFGRAREFAVRRALGATRRRMARLLLIETTVLSATGGALGIALAAWLVAGLPYLPFLDLPRLGAVRVDGSVVAFTALVTLAVAAAAGLVPAVASAGTRGAGALRAPAPAGTGASARVRRALVLAEVAVTVPLVVTAGLLLRSVVALGAVNVGFDADRVIAFDLALRGPERYRGPAERARFLATLERRLAGLPGVRAVGAISRAPLSGRRWTNPYALGGVPPTTWNGPAADFRMVTPGYFTAAGTRMLAGRAFTENENRVEDRRVAIVDETLAARLGGPAAAVGRRIAFPLDGRPVAAEIVGVAEDVQFESLRAVPRAAIYVPYRHEASRDLAVLVRAENNPRGFAPGLRRVVHDADAELALYNVRILADDVARAEAPTLIALGLLTVFSLASIGMALFGLYALLAFMIRARTREIGVRLAIGATPRGLARAFVVEGGRLIAAGIVVGTAVAFAVTPAVGTLLFRVGPTDAVSYLGAAALVAAAGLLASSVPARRAGRTNPMEALRHE